MSEVELKRVILLEPLSRAQNPADLEYYGEITLMFGYQGAYQAPGVILTKEFQDTILKWLEENDYNTETDLFVISGRLTKVCVAIAAIKDYVRGELIPVLIYDGINNEYVERHI